MNYTFKVTDFLSNLADVFSGNCNHNNSEINHIRDEIFAISHTPNTYDDKAILKSDINTVLKDTQKAQRNIKLEKTR